MRSWRVELWAHGNHSSNFNRLQDRFPHNFRLRDLRLVTQKPPRPSIPPPPPTWTMYKPSSPAPPPTIMRPPSPRRSPRLKQPPRRSASRGMAAIATPPTLLKGGNLKQNPFFTARKREAVEDIETKPCAKRRKGQVQVEVGVELSSSVISGEPGLDSREMENFRMKRCGSPPSVAWTGWHREGRRAPPAGSRSIRAPGAARLVESSLSSI